MLRQGAYCWWVPSINISMETDADKNRAGKNWFKNGVKNGVKNLGHIRTPTLSLPNLVAWYQKARFEHTFRRSSLLITYSLPSSRAQQMRELSRAPALWLVENSLPAPPHPGKIPELPESDQQKSAEGGGHSTAAWPREGGGLWAGGYSWATVKTTMLDTQRRTKVDLLKPRKTVLI